MNEDKPEVIHLPGEWEEDQIQCLTKYLLDAIKPLNTTHKRDKYIDEDSDAVTFDGVNYVLTPHLRAILQLFDKSSVTIITSGSKDITAVGRPTVTLEGVYICERDTDTCSFLVYRTPKGHKATLTQEQVQTDNTTAPDPWLVKACAKDDTRPNMMKSYGWCATDAFRLHILTDQPRTKTPFDVSVIYDPTRLYGNIVTMTTPQTSELIRACKRAAKIKTSHIKLTINGRLDYAASYDDFEVSGTIEGIQHTGIEFTVALNPRYLLDALDKPADCMLAFSDQRPDKSPMLYTDGLNREAIIMPMHIED